MVQLQTDAALHQELSAAVKAQNDGTFTAQMPHPLGICTGNCPYHPLFQPDHDEFMYGFWGKWNDNLFAEDYARETPEQTAKRLALEAARDAAAKVEAEVIRQHLYATELAFKQSIGVKKLPKGAEPLPPRKLILQPCKWLYAVPGVDGVFSNSPCAECWGHEYTDAKGVKLAPHKCLYVHRNQPEWKAEWDALPVTRNHWRAPKPVAAAAPVDAATAAYLARCAALAPAAAPQPAPAPKRFETLAAPTPKTKKNLPAGPSGW
jgi:hypothetical protein